MKKENFMQWNNRILKESFAKIKLNILWITALDAFFYFICGYLVYYWVSRMQQKLMGLDLPPQNELISLGYSKAQEVLSITKSYYALLILSMIFMIIITIFLSSIFKSMIWSSTTKTKINISFISKFLALNLIWMSFWILLILSIAFLIESRNVYSFFAAATILGIYFTSILYSLFVKTPKISMIGKAIFMGVNNIRNFAIPYAAFLAVIYLILWLSIKTKFILSEVLYTILFLLALAVLRFYFSTIVYDLDVRNKR